MRDKIAGQFADEFIANPRRLTIAHSLLGLAATIAYWVRPGTYILPLRYSPNMIDPSPILLTFIAWCPYAISAAVSRRVLGVRDKKATILFIILAAATTATSIIMYLNLAVMKSSVSPIVISAGATVALLIACGLCALLWPNDAPE